MLANQDYLSTYPALAAFLAQHPEIAKNPAFFVGTEHGRNWNDDAPQAAVINIWRNLVDGIQMFAVFLVVTGVLTWLVKTLVDYRRWLRISRVQAEVHTKLLDRFASSEELLSYIQTPAGRRFLESSPIPLDAESRPSLSAPLGRILWSDSDRRGPRVGRLRAALRGQPAGVVVYGGTAAGDRRARHRARRRFRRVGGHLVSAIVSTGTAAWTADDVLARQLRVGMTTDD